MLQPSEQTSWSRSIRIWRCRKPIARLVVLTLLLLPFAARPPSVALAYSCPDGGTHCFGIVSWPGAIDGAATNIVMRPLSYGARPGFMNNEIWLIGHAAAGQPNCYFQQHTTDCWVEAGNHNGSFYIGDTPNGFCSPDCYWWADERPSPFNGSSYTWTNYHDHFMGTIPSGDYGLSAGFALYNKGGGSWEVDITAPSNVWTDTSTGNNMVTNGPYGSMQIGGELSDSSTSGGSSPLADYGGTEFRNGSGTWYYQGSDGTLGGWWYLPSGPNPNGLNVQNNSIWYAQWYSYPSRDHAGGDFQTSCC